MSAIKDAAVAVKEAVDALGASVDALSVKVDEVVAALANGSPADLAEAVAALAAAKDEAIESKASADESVQNIVDAIPPSA